MYKPKPFEETLNLAFVFILLLLSKLAQILSQSRFKNEQQNFHNCNRQCKKTKFKSKFFY